jgi:hypothetical protein
LISRNGGNLARVSDIGSSFVKPSALPRIIEASE